MPAPVEAMKPGTRVNGASGRSIPVFTCGASFSSA